MKFIKKKYLGIRYNYVNKVLNKFYMNCFFFIFLIIIIKCVINIIGCNICFLMNFGSGL